MFDLERFKFQSSGWFTTRQEQRLALILALVVVCAGAYRILATGGGLWASQYTSIDVLESRIRMLEQDIRENDLVTRQRLVRRRLSLPADSTLAATRYYTWLHELSSKHGWTEVKIDSTAPTTEPNLGERISYSVQGRASVESIGRWIDEFQGYPLLHGLTSLQILDYSPLSGEARVQLSADTLCTQDAPADMQLRVTDSAEVADDRLAACLIERNPFRRYEPPKPVTVMPVEIVPPIDPLTKVKFVGIVAQNTRPQAWFFNSMENREVLVPIGSPIVVPGFEGRLNKLDQDCATLEHQGQSIQVRLGQDLRSAISPASAGDD